MSNTNTLHSFHIPVMGLAYTIDTPLRVAQYGIDSVVSIVDDELIEKMRSFFCRQYGIAYSEITTKMNDYRAERITNYLNLMNDLVKEKFNTFCNDLKANKEEFDRFIAMLPQNSFFKKKAETPMSSDEKAKLIDENLYPGAIDVNIMTKVDKVNYKDNAALSSEYNDAHAALRGFANSKLTSSLVLSAGMNPSLYNYIASFPDFLPYDNVLKKRIILKVSDFRSAMIQGNYLAKKGIWVSEFRIESGLNCGGHSFATNGLLLGPILQEFRERREELISGMHTLLVKALADKNIEIPEFPLAVRITVQGGVGTAEEHDFLLQSYNLDAVGWGSPFLLVPEATATDTATRKLLAEAKEEDLYRSHISPLGIPFNAVKGMSNDYYKALRISKDKAGSSCPKKLLAMNAEFGGQGMCTASRKYQQLKLSSTGNEHLSDEEIKQKEQSRRLLLEKACLCVGLANPAYMEKQMEIKGEQQGVVVCPGPNIAYFDREVSLANMVRHIYGYRSILSKADRPHVFVKELQLTIKCLEEEIENELWINPAKVKQWLQYKANVLTGIAYYERLLLENGSALSEAESFKAALHKCKQQVFQILIPEV